MSSGEDISSRIKKAINGIMIAAARVMHPEEVLPPPTILWHYTKAEALASILKSRSIYATQFDYLNDPSEIRLFGTIAKEIATERLKGLPELEEHQDLKTLEEYKAAWWTFALELEEMFLFESICVTCFSEVGDLLGQWRAYADNCRGYALGLSAEWLSNQAISKTFPFRLLRVVYEPKRQVELVATVLDAAIEELSAILSMVSGDDAYEIFDRYGLGYLLHRLTAEFSPAVKNQAYKDEREWRLLSFANSMDVRPVNGNFVRFTTIDLNDSDMGHPFREIKLGPRNNVALEQPALRSLLDKLALEKDVQLSNSHIPVRD
jgi:hypothetical protein